jgi:hypothetical protein
MSTAAARGKVRATSKAAGFTKDTTGLEASKVIPLFASSPLLLCPASFVDAH